MTDQLRCLRCLLRPEPIEPEIGGQYAQSIYKGEAMCYWHLRDQLDDNGVDMTDGFFAGAPEILDGL